MTRSCTTHDWVIPAVSQCRAALCASRQGIGRCLLTICVVVCNSAVIAELIDKTDQQLLDDSEYRIGLEEIVVTGKQPQWRQPEQEAWRPERFELPEEPVTKARIQWFPKYDKDERDLYQGVRDRTGEKAEIKIFEWKF